LPRPPIILVDSDAAHFSNREKSTRFLIWTFLLAAMDGIVGHEEIVCPIRETLPVLGASLSFDDPCNPGRSTNCLPFIASKTCGRFDGGYLSTQPSCHFVRIMEFLAGEEWGIHLQPRREKS
jgi:hypothetical protein